MDNNNITVGQLFKYAEALHRDALKKRVEALSDVYGSVRAAGRALNIDHAYLARLRDGKKTNPSKSVLRKLGLENELGRG